MPPRGTPHCRKKSLSRQKRTKKVDRISSLPDDILIHILSSLPTKQAFLTSILSKRWKHLWCYLPVLEFIKTNKVKDQYLDSCLFDEFVYSVLRSRNAAGNHAIHSFILDINTCYNWGRRTQLSNTILTCTTLVVLKLSYLNMCTHFCYYPIILPSLKTLHLKDIRIDQYGDLKRLLDLEYCPVLEDLQLYIVSFLIRNYSKARCETLTKLNRAEIIQCDCGVLMKALSNVVFLHIKLSRVYLHNDFPTFNNLTHLVLNYRRGINLQMLHHCPKLQTLDLYQKIQGSIWQYDPYVPILDRNFDNWTLPKSVPSCLSLNLTTCTMWDFGFGDLQEKHIRLARYILNNSAVLETMSIWSKLKLSQIKRKLFSCSRSSETSKLSVYSEHI